MNNDQARFNDLVGSGSLLGSIGNGRALADVLGTQGEPQRYRERYFVNCDPGNALLIAQKCSYGFHKVHRDVYMEATGCATPEEPRRLIAEEMLRRGWLFRERWWQFWRPLDPR